MLDYLGLLDLGFVDWNDTKTFDTGYSDIGACLTAISRGGFSGSGFGFLDIGVAYQSIILYKLTLFIYKIQAQNCPTFCIHYLPL